MNILYCGDGRIKDGLLISVLSLLKNTNEPLDIYVMTAGFEYCGRMYKQIEEADMGPLRRRMAEAGPEHRLTLIDVSDMFNQSLPKANMGTRFTPCCMLRLLADRVECLPDKILYLDNDVVFRANPESFYNQDISDVEIVGVLDHYGSWLFRKNLFHRDYINSGVLLINLAKVRSTGLFARCMDRCSRIRMFMPDQSAINLLSQSKRIAPRKYNEQRRLREDTVMQHFTTSFRFFPWLHTVCVKPWEVERMHSVLHIHEYDDILTEYTNLARL